MSRAVAGRLSTGNSCLCSCSVLSFGSSWRALSRSISSDERPSEALAPPPLSRTTRAVGLPASTAWSAMATHCRARGDRSWACAATVPKARSELDLCRERWPGRRVSVQGAPCGLGLGEGKTPSTWVVHRVARAQRSLRAESVTPSTERPLAPEFRVAGRPSPTSTATGAGFQRRRPQVQLVRATPDPRRR